MRITRIVSLFVLGLLFLSSCGVTKTDQKRVKFETDLGDIIIQVNTEWAPIGAKRFLTLVEAGFYDEC